jgi:hypothetical protein
MIDSGTETQTTNIILSLEHLSVVENNEIDKQTKTHNDGTQKPTGSIGNRQSSNELSNRNKKTQ